jgi:hypothetical protein
MALIAHEPALDAQKEKSAVIAGCRAFQQFAPEPTDPRKGSVATLESNGRWVGVRIRS